ncbi:Rhs family protein [Enterobacter cloacae]|uniref:Rhs family protein n=1 Tax=Enterobacter cloacae TaxID=550 RepID=A0A377M4S2_ENTCL|nr:Rhs family protein [Enterobacter cloacae]
MACAVPAITLPSRTCRKGMRTYCESEKKTGLKHHHDDSWSVYDVSGERWHYAALKDDAPSLLQRISEPCGNDILFRVECG